MAGLLKVDHIFLRMFDTFFHGHGNFFGFAHSETDLAHAVAYHHKYAEAETLTAFDDFADAVDGNYAL